INAQALYDYGESMAGPVIVRGSIFALGLSPILFVLVCAEAIKLLFEPLQRWEAASASNRDRLTFILRVVILLFAGLQAWQLAWGLEAAEGLVHEPGRLFEIG